MATTYGQLRFFHFFLIILQFALRHIWSKLIDSNSLRKVGTILSLIPHLCSYKHRPAEDLSVDSDTSPLVP